MNLINAHSSAGRSVNTYPLKPYIATPSIQSYNVLVVLPYEIASFGPKSQQPNSQKPIFQKKQNKLLQQMAPHVV